MADTIRGLTLVAEAAAFGKDTTQVRRARQRPDHPANGPHAVRAGRSVEVPLDEATEFWRNWTPGKPGPKRTRADA